MGEDRREQGFKQRYNVSDAARILGISPEAVRTRLSRGTLESVKEGRRVYVLLKPDVTTSDNDRTDDRTRYVNSLDEQVEYLRGLLDAEREANRENRRIIAGLTSRIPALEAGPPADASSEAPGSTENVSEPVHSADAPPRRETPTEPRPWWRRLLGGKRDFRA